MKYSTTFVMAALAFACFTQAASPPHIPFLEGSAVDEELLENGLAKTLRSQLKRAPSNPRFSLMNVDTGRWADFSRAHTVEQPKMKRYVRRAKFKKPTMVPVAEMAREFNARQDRAKEDPVAAMWETMWETEAEIKKGVGTSK